MSFSRPARLAAATALGGALVVASAAPAMASTDASSQQRHVVVQSSFTSVNLQSSSVEEITTLLHQVADLIAPVFPEAAEQLDWFAEELADYISNHNDWTEAEIVDVLTDLGVSANTADAIAEILTGLV